MLAMLLSFGGFYALRAQQYDLAVVSYIYDTPKPQILISVNGEKFTQQDVERDQMDGKSWGISLNPLIKAVNKMQSEGWEVVGGCQMSWLGPSSISSWYYSMRKKK